MAPKKAKKTTGPSKAESALRKAAQTTLEQGQQQTLDELMGWLQANPAQASSILASIKAKAFDMGGEQEPSDRLPPYMNKLKALPKGKLIEYISGLVPHMSRWLGNLDRKTRKDDLASILAFLIHMKPESALTTKRESKLKLDFQERWAKNGKRAASWEAEGGVEAFWKQNSYWSLEIKEDGSGFLCYRADGEADKEKNRVSLPTDMISKETVLEGGHLFDGAVIKKGNMMRAVSHLLSELGVAS
ncbi:hypothetical protein AK812_SmicGene48115, partial [Symbiodinium microadriaticum]